MSGVSTSIDDLLQHEEEPPPTVRRRPGLVRTWLRGVLIAAVLTGALLAALRMVGVAFSPAAVFAAFLALLLLRRITSALAPEPPERVRVDRRSTRGGEDGSDNRAAQDALGSVIGRWENRLAWAQKDPDRFARRVLPMLGELADELLRQRHGLTRATDPERARALLGDQLWTFLDTRPKRTPSPRELAAIVAQLEKV
ncbi:hypothetical protein [Micromonospora sp. HM5-17]|uniref:hypothetical protein n=1 Tax=Micromonospora sp. HM5-17 TaxID=2487710 RepID=UPI000F46C61C|nr:hypothetical protein [Micromonospora sp. HM5-17]ROT31505.1 hypothetical protein EF879_13775 [Micromonospora sp. HM5-17]